MMRNTCKHTLQILVAHPSKIILCTSMRHILALHFMALTNAKVTGSFSPFIKVATGICTTNNSTVVFYHLKICKEDQAFNDKLMIVLKVNSRPAKSETTFYPTKLGPRPWCALIHNGSTLC